MPTNPRSTNITNPLFSPPLSLFPHSSATQLSFSDMRKGALLHHDSVVKQVLSSDPIKDYILAKEQIDLQASNNAKAPPSSVTDLGYRKVTEETMLSTPLAAVMSSSPSRPVLPPLNLSLSSHKLETQTRTGRLSSATSKQHLASCASPQDNQSLVRFHPLASANSEIVPASPLLEEGEIPSSELQVSPIHPFLVSLLLSAKIHAINTCKKLPQRPNALRLTMEPTPSSDLALTTTRHPSVQHHEGEQQQDPVIQASSLNHLVGVQLASPLIHLVEEQPAISTQPDPVNNNGTAEGLGPMSWARRLNCSKLSNHIPLEYFPNSDDSSDIELEEGEFESEISNCKNYVVGYFVGRRLPLHLVKRDLDAQWILKGSYDISVRGDKCFYFKFHNVEDRAMVMERGMTHIASHLFILRDWTPGIEIEAVSLTTIPIWVVFKGIPEYLSNTRGYGRLGSKIGVPLFPDVSTANNPGSSTARVCVEITAHCKFPNTISVSKNNTSWGQVEVEYPWKPARCQLCNTFSHSSFYCNMKDPQVSSKEHPVEGHHKNANNIGSKEIHSCHANGSKPVPAPTTNASPAIVSSSVTYNTNEATSIQLVAETNAIQSPLTTSGVVTTSAFVPTSVTPLSADSPHTTAVPTSVAPLSADSPHTTAVTSTSTTSNLTELSTALPLNTLVADTVNATTLKLQPSAQHPPGSSGTTSSTIEWSHVKNKHFPGLIKNNIQPKPPIHHKNKLGQQRFHGSSQGQFRAKQKDYNERAHSSTPSTKGASSSKLTSPQDKGKGKMQPPIAPTFSNRSSSIRILSREDHNSPLSPAKRCSSSDSNQCCSLVPVPSGQSSKGPQ